MRQETKKISRGGLSFLPIPEKHCLEADAGCARMVFVRSKLHYIIPSPVSSAPALCAVQSLLLSR